MVQIIASEFVTVYLELGNLAQSRQMGFESSSLVSNFGANRSTLVFSSSELLGVAGGGLDLRVGGWPVASKFATGHFKLGDLAQS